MQEDTPEELIASWQEPADQREPLPSNLRTQVVGGAVLLVAILIIGWFFLREIALIFGAAGVIAGMFAILAQAKRTRRSRNVTLTNWQLTIDTQSYALTDLAGFWLQNEPDGLVIMFEYAKPSLMPISCYAPGDDQAEIRSVIGQVLPEVEARKNNIADGPANYFRF